MGGGGGCLPPLIQAGGRVEGGGGGGGLGAGGRGRGGANMNNICLTLERQRATTSDVSGSLIG